MSHSAQWKEQVQITRLSERFGFDHKISPPMTATISEVTDAVEISIAPRSGWH